MRKRHLWLITVVVLALVATLSLAACGSSTTSTTAGPTTTAGGATTTAAGATTTAGSAVDAAALYAQYCAGCHQIIPAGSADRVATVLQSGKQSMPAFADQLTADQITALATWVANGGK
jgi:mono/diheme cytochrome c family protein